MLRNNNIEMSLGTDNKEEMEMRETHMLIEEELINVIITPHAEQRTMERTIEDEEIFDLIRKEFDTLLDAKVGEAVKVQDEESGLTMPIAVNVLDDFSIELTVITCWIDEGFLVYQARETQEGEL